MPRITLAMYEAKRARVLKAAIERPLQLLSSPNLTDADYQRARSDAYQATNDARYFAQYYALNRHSFLNACGLRAEMLTA